MIKLDGFYFFITYKKIIRYRIRIDCNADLSVSETLSLEQEICTGTLTDPVIISDICP
jgi:hypothetical protein